MTDVSALYFTLRDAALDCMDHVRFDEDASKVFKTRRVQEALESAMKMTIKVLELISQYYSKPMISTSHI